MWSSGCLWATRNPKWCAAAQSKALTCVLQRAVWHYHSLRSSFIICLLIVHLRWKRVEWGRRWTLVWSSILGRAPPSFTWLVLSFSEKLYIASVKTSKCWLLRRPLMALGVFWPLCLKPWNGFYWCSLNLSHRNHGEGDWELSLKFPALFSVSSVIPLMKTRTQDPSCFQIKII